MMILLGAALVIACLGALFACFAYVNRRINRLLRELSRPSK